jgi:hypothetical protein
MQSWITPAKQYCPDHETVVTPRSGGFYALQGMEGGTL